MVWIKFSYTDEMYFCFVGWRLYQRNTHDAWIFFNDVSLNFKLVHTLFTQFKFSTQGPNFSIRDWKLSRIMGPLKRNRTWYKVLLIINLGTLIKLERITKERSTVNASRVNKGSRQNSSATMDDQWVFYIQRRVCRIIMTTSIGFLLMSQVWISPNTAAFGWLGRGP